MRFSRVFTLVSAIFLFFSIGSSTIAAVPQVINYQGKLSDAGGAPVADGGNLVSFSIYSAAVGGAALWSSGFQNVATVNGLFSYSLGSNVALPDNLFTDTSRYLGIIVGIDPEISPRSRLETSAYAYHALRADTALVAQSSTGVTQIFDEGKIVSTCCLNILGTDSINCPTSGFVMVNVSMSTNVNHTSGNEDVLFIMLTDSTLTVTQDQNGHAWSIPLTAASGFYGNIIHSHKVYAVSAGWNEFNVLGFQNPGLVVDNFSTADVTLSLLFVPQSLGSVAVGTPTPPSSKFNLAPKKMK